MAGLFDAMILNGACWQAKLVSPEAVAVAVRAYAEENNRQNHERRRKQKRPAALLRRLRGALKGSWTPSRMECISRP